MFFRKFHEPPDTLSSCSTTALVQELQKREAVDSMVIAPHEDIPIIVNGPAIILIVRD